MIQILLMLVLSYLAGSVPTAILTGKIVKNIDIREHGSGNAGATNVFRVLGWKAGLFVLLIDMLKGLVATVLIYKIAVNAELLSPVILQILAGLSAVIGHVYTVFAGFKGGKGVGTGAGMVIGLVPGAVVAGLIVFVISVALTRFVSLGSILASITVPVYLLVRHFALHQPQPLPILILGFIIPVLIILTHRSNIRRLLSGSENKIVFRKS